MSGHGMLGLAQLAVALFSGSLFGLGLAVSGMLKPRDQGFLDIFG
jgi:hypothetical protein